MSDSLAKLVADSDVEFDPVAEDEIVNAERQLTCRFPPSYRNFLLQYGAGTHGEVFDPVQVVAYAKRLRRDRGFPDQLLPIFEQEDEYFCCLDVAALRDDGDCPGYGIDLAYESSDGRCPDDYQHFRESDTFTDRICSYLADRAS